jgi:hypothetical protein
VRQALMAVAAVVVLVAGLSAAGDALPPVLVSRETTYITSPLTSDGLPDYGTFLDQRGDAGVALADNAAPVVLEIVGIEIDAATRRRLALPETAAIGPRLRRSPVGGDRSWSEDRARRGITAPDADEISRRFFAEMPRARAGPWKPEEAPLVAEWLADNDEAIDAVAEAVSRNGYWWPRWPAGLLTGDAPSLFLLRGAGDALAWRGALRAGTGRGPEAVDDLVASLRLGCLAGRGASLLDGMIAAALRIGAAEAIVAVAPHLHPRDAERVLDGLSDLPEIPSADWSLEAERALQLSIALDMRRLGATRGTRAWKPYLEIEPLREAPAGIYDVDPLRVDWNEVLRLVNRTCDGDLEARGTGSTALVREGVGLFDPTGTRRLFANASASLARAREAARRAAGVDEPPGA